MAAERIEELGLDIEEISEKNAQLHDSLAQLVRAVQNIRSRGRSEHQIKEDNQTLDSVSQTIIIEVEYYTVYH